MRKYLVINVSLAALLWTISYVVAEEGHEIYYTLDGSTPNVNSKKYEGALEISEDGMLSTPVISNQKTTDQRDGFSFESSQVKKAAIIKVVSSYKRSKTSGREYSSPLSATYILNGDLFDSDLPIISLTTDSRKTFDYREGIYVPGYWDEEDNINSGNYYQKGRQYERISNGFF